MNLTFEEFLPNYSVQIYISMIVSFLITWRAIPLIINICNNSGLMAIPIKRSSHQMPTPTFGGVAIFAGLIISYMLWNFGDEGILIHKVLSGIIILFFLGIKDDLYALSASKKLITQIIVSALVVIGSDLRITDFFGILGIHEIPYLISVLFTILLFVSLINAINLIDGIDGLAGGIAMIASGVFGVWFLLNEFWSLACLALTLCSSLLGFLRYNFSKSSKIFMGDTGSLLVGYLITVFAVKFVHYNVNNEFAPNSHFISAPIIAIVLLSVPIFDTLRVFGLRILRGNSPFKADRLHMHHLLVDNNLSHIGASFVFYTFTIIFTLVTYISRAFFSNTVLLIFIMTVFVSYLVLGYYLEIRRLKNHKENLLKKEATLKNESSFSINDLQNLN